MAATKVYAHEVESRFSLNAEVQPECVRIGIKNNGPAAELNENMVIEMWEENKRSWIFAACPLWMCATKETVFRRPIAAGETVTVRWEKKIHNRCRKAESGRYRIYIKGPDGRQLSEPVSFILKEDPGTGDIRVKKTAAPELGEIRYSAGSESCRVVWTVYTSPVNAGVVKHHVRCSTENATLVPHLKAVLKTVLSRDTSPEGLQTLFWGRLVTDKIAEEWDLSYRLSLAAYRSKLWNSGTGRPFKGHENRAILRIVNEADIFPELKALFEDQNKTVRFSGAEKVIIRKAGDLPFFNKLRPCGVPPSALLPVDCLTWFSIHDQ